MIRQTSPVQEEDKMDIQVSGFVAGIISVVVGIVVIIWPRFLAIIVGLYLIVIGGLAIWNSIGD